MTRIVERTTGKTRDLPIHQNLRDLLWVAARDAGVDEVSVISGGQAPVGSGGRRTGSTRHDFGHAADIQLIKDGRTLDFGTARDRAIFEGFVRAAASYGASGIGAGAEYMGTQTIHVGFGSWSVGWWGKGGRKANTPEWLKNAMKEGWRNPSADSPSIIRESDYKELVGDTGTPESGPPGSPTVYIIKPKSGWDWNDYIDDWLHGWTSDAETAFRAKGYDVQIVDGCDVERFKALLAKTSTVGVVIAGHGTPFDSGIQVDTKLVPEKGVSLKVDDLSERGPNLKFFGVVGCSVSTRERENIAASLRIGIHNVLKAPAAYEDENQEIKGFEALEPVLKKAANMLQPISQPQRIDPVGPDAGPVNRDSASPEPRDQGPVPAGGMPISRVGHAGDQSPQFEARSFLAELDKGRHEGALEQMVYSHSGVEFDSKSFLTRISEGMKAESQEQPAAASGGSIFDASAFLTAVKSDGPQNSALSTLSPPLGEMFNAQEFLTSLQQGTGLPPTPLVRSVDTGEGFHANAFLTQLRNNSRTGWYKEPADDTDNNAFDARSFLAELTVNLDNGTEAEGAAIDTSRQDISSKYLADLISDLRSDYGSESTGFAMAHQIDSMDIIGKLRDSLEPTKPLDQITTGLHAADHDYQTPRTSEYGDGGVGLGAQPSSYMAQNLFGTSTSAGYEPPTTFGSSGMLTTSNLSGGYAGPPVMFGA